METKICTVCGRQLPIENFYWRNKAKGQRRADCKDCHNNYVKSKYKERREEIESIKAKQRCAKCGDSRGYVLDFHHIEPENKKQGISRMLSNNFKMETIKKEMNKCVCLCANCHREFHYFEKYKQITIQQYLGS